jgi:hypothetical protein
VSYSHRGMEFSTLMHVDMMCSTRQNTVLDWIEMLSCLCTITGHNTSSKKTGANSGKAVDHLSCD